MGDPAKELFYENYAPILDFVKTGKTLPKERDVIKAFALLLYNYRHTKIVSGFRANKKFNILSSYNKGKWVARYNCLKDDTCRKLARIAGDHLIEKGLKAAAKQRKKR